MQSRLIRVALSVLSTFSCILFDKDFKLQNAIKNELREERLRILVRIILQTKSDATIQMKALCLHFHMVLFVCQNFRK